MAGRVGRNEPHSGYSDALLKLPPQQFKLIMDSIVWATKHTMRDIGDLGQEGDAVSIG
jgi:hypothetical protein